MGKFEDDKSAYESFLKNTELRDNFINSSDRDAVLTGYAALDVLLERLLKKFRLQESSSGGLTKESSSKFSTKIDACYSLGLISEDEKHDLDRIRKVRNAFAHNLFRCSFTDSEIADFISNLKIARKANATPGNMGLRAFFTVGVFALDNMISYRIETCQSRAKCQNMFINGN